MKRSLHVMAVTLAAVSALAFSAGESYSASTVVADPDVRGHEVGVHGERLLVVLDRLLEPARLHEQLGVGV